MNIEFKHKQLPYNFSNSNDMIEQFKRTEYLKYKYSNLIGGVHDVIDTIDIINTVHKEFFHTK